MSIVSFTGCEKEKLSTPSGFTIEQDGNYLVLQWNGVQKATSYEISKNGNYWETTSVTRIIDKNPEKGWNNYELVAYNANEDVYSSPSHGSCYFEPQGGGGGESIELDAPTGLTLSQTSSAVLLSWNKVNGADGYGIFRALPDDEEWSYLDETNSPSATNYSDYNVVSGYTYYYAVVAYALVPDYSDSIIISDAAMDYITFAGTSGGGGGGSSKPSTPSGITATASSSSIIVTWNSVSGADSYKVYRATSSNGNYSVLSNVYSTSYTDYSVSAGTTYYYKVSAVNNAGESSMSSYASAKISSGGGGGGGDRESSPCPPTVSVSGTSSQNITWTVSTTSGCGTPTSYEVYKYNPQTESWEKKTTTTSKSYSCPSSSIHPGINRYAVKAINSLGDATGYGNSSEVPLSKPSSFTAQKYGNDQIKFTWSSVSQATGYQIFESSSASGTYVLCEQIEGGSTKQCIKYYPASSGTTRYFKIKSVYYSGYIIVYSDLTSYKSVTF